MRLFRSIACALSLAALALAGCSREPTPDASTPTSSAFSAVSTRSFRYLTAAGRIIVLAMASVGRLLPPELRETGEGGIADTPTGRRIALAMSR